MPKTQSVSSSFIYHLRLRRWHVGAELACMYATAVGNDEIEPNHIYIYMEIILTLLLPIISGVLLTRIRKYCICDEICCQVNVVEVFESCNEDSDNPITEKLD